MWSVNQHVRFAVVLIGKHSGRPVLALESAPSDPDLAQCQPAEVNSDRLAAVGAARVDSLDNFAKHSLEATDCGPMACLNSCLRQDCNGHRCIQPVSEKKQRHTLFSWNEKLFT